MPGGAFVGLYMARVLIVSPFVTHPVDRGSSRRIRTLAASIGSLGYEVHFALAPNWELPKGGLDEMNRHWKDKLHVLTHRFPCTFFGWRRRQLCDALTPLLERLLCVGESRFKHTDADGIYHRWWNIQLYRLQRVYRFNAVVVEYVFYSQALSVFGDGVVKLIDSHDVFADRQKRVEREGAGQVWWSTDPDSEAAALQRADAVIAIQRDEAADIRQRVKCPVVCIPHLQAVAANADSGPDADVILTVGSPNCVNERGIKWFVEQVLPLVIIKRPKATLWVVGSVCEKLVDWAKGVTHVELIGPVGRLEEPYNNADVIINPVQFGTGLAIKSVEAMAYGKALVTTPAGARGLPESDGAYVVSESATSMASAIVSLLSSAAMREEMGTASLKLIDALNKNTMSTLAKLLSQLEAKGTPDPIPASDRH